MPYPDPQILVNNNSAISPGLLIRYTPVDVYGTPSDTQDCIVRQIEPIDGIAATDGRGSGYRLWVTVLELPPCTAPRRLIGDIRVAGQSSRNIDISDVILRADSRHSRTLVKYVDALAVRGSDLVTRCRRVNLSGANLASELDLHNLIYDAN